MFFKTLIFIPFIFLIVACSSYSNDKQLFLHEIAETVVEGNNLKISLYNKEKIKNISITTSAEKEVFFINNGLNAELIAPNVDKEVTFKIMAEITDIDNIQYTEHQTIKVTPANIRLPNVMPEPNVFSGTTKRYEGVILDGNLVPLVNYNGETVYHPTYIAKYAYNHYMQYYTFRDEESLSKFLNSTNWLKNNCLYTKFGFCSFRFNFPVTSWQVSYDWTSAMAQGEALTSLIAASYITKDISYLEVAYDALSAFQYPVEFKGVSSYGEDTIWFEEYGSEELRSGVLNGFLFSMSGIRSFNKLYPELLLSNFLFDTGVKALEIRLPLMDIGFTSLYNNSPNLPDEFSYVASAKNSADFDAYHEVHIYQLGWLSGIVNSEIIESYFSKFLTYDFGDLTGTTGVKDSGLGTKFINITASHTISPETHGVNRLTDENWTYGTYWSSSESPVYLDIELNKDFLDKKFLKKVVISSMSMETIPDVMHVYYLDEFGVEQFVATNYIKGTYETKWDMQTANYPSTTIVIPVNVSVNSENIRLYFEGGSIIAIRELNLFYDRETLKNVIKKIYPYR